MPRRLPTAHNYALNDAITVWKTGEQGRVAGFAVEYRGRELAGTHYLPTLLDFMSKFKEDTGDISGMRWLVLCELGIKDRRYRYAEDLRPSKGKITRKVKPA